MAVTPEAIQRFITPGSPIAQAGGAQMLLRATGGNLHGAAFLAALARKESEFGRTSGRFRNNAWGWGVHLGPEVNTAPDWETMARRVWKGLNSGLYKGAGLTTPGAIINRYAPPSENNTDLYKTQVGQWFTQLGLTPNTNVFSGARVPVPAGGGGGGGGGGFRPPTGPAPGRGRGVDALAEAAPQPLRLSPKLQRQLDAYLAGSAEDVLAGRTPRDVFPIVAGISAAATSRAATAAPAVRDFQGRIPRAVSEMHSDFDPSPGGKWGGAQGPAERIAKISGLPVTSTKRSTRNTASGNVSDHWTGSTNSYAVDLGTSGAEGDAAFTKIMRALGHPELRPGQWHNINIGGYRYQVGWRTPGHFDHIHVGVKRL